MTNQELIARYQDKFGDKTISFWAYFEFYEDSKWQSSMVCGLELFYDWLVKWNQLPYDLREWDLSADGYDNYNKIRGVPYKVIWHPLTRGRLYQEVWKVIDWESENYTDIDRPYIVTTMMQTLTNALMTHLLLDKTIYDRVKIEEIKTILLEIRNKWDD